MSNEYFTLYNEIAEKYPEEAIVYATPQGQSREQLIKALILPELKGLTLDIGCNDGHYAKYIKEYIGIDMARAALHKFRRYKQYKYRVQGLAEMLPFSDCSFDSVFISEIIEHVKNPLKVLHEIYRILKQNGQVLITTPAGNNSEQIVWPAILTDYGVTKHPYLHSEFSKAQLTDMLTQVGFVDVAVHNPLAFQLIGVAYKK